MDFSYADMVVGYAVDAWGMQRHANGVATYTAIMAQAIREAGARAYVVPIDVEGPCKDSYVLPCPHWRERHNIVGRTAIKIGWRIAPKRIDLRLNAGSILRAVRQLYHDAGLQVFEMEEAHGTAGLLATSSPVPIVVRLHGPWLTTGLMVKGVTQRDFEDRVSRERTAIQRAAGLSAVSHDVLGRVRSYYELDLPDAAVIPNPISPVVPDQRWLPALCDPDRILFVGRFDRHKGGDIIIQAFARILRVRPQTRLTFVGPDCGCIDDVRREWSLPQYVRRHLPLPWMQERFEWLGLRSPQEIHALRRASFACVVASRYETFSMVTLESLAAGCPVVAPDVGGISEMVRHERNGLLFRMGDPADLADKILHLMGQSGMAEVIGRQAGIDAAEHYNPGTIAQRSLDFYREVMDRFHQSSHTRTWMQPQSIQT